MSEGQILCWHTLGGGVYPDLSEEKQSFVVEKIEVFFGVNF